MSPRFAWLTTTMVLMPEPARKEGASTKAEVPDFHGSAYRRMLWGSTYRAPLGARFPPIRQRKNLAA